MVCNRKGYVFGLSAFALKIIAVITMVTDHVGLLLYPDDLTYRIVGRLSFPIYCFLLVEGFCHTSDFWKYVRRLVFFAVLSEIPYDLMLTGNIFDVHHQNVFFTLLIGLITIYGMNRTLNYTVKMFIMVAGCMASMALLTDYSFYGVILVCVFFCFRDNRLSSCIAMILMSAVSGKVQLYAAFSAIPLMMYNGSKGPDFYGSRICKYGFYAIYPIHIIILYFLSKLMW